MSAGGREATAERQVYRLLPSGEEEFVRELSTQERMQALLKDVQAVQAAGEQAGEPGVAPQTPWPVIAVTDKLSASLSEVQVMLDVLQWLQHPESFVKVGPAENARPANSKALQDVLVQRAFQSETMTHVSAMLMATSKSLGQSLVSAQELDREAVLLGKRWILYSKRDGSTAVDYRCSTPDVRFVEGGAADLVRNTPSETAHTSTDAMDVEDAGSSTTNLRLVVPAAHRSNVRVSLSLTSHPADTTPIYAGIPAELFPRSAGIVHPIHLQLLAAQESQFENDLLQALHIEARGSKSFGLVSFRESAVHAQVDDQHRVHLHLTDKPPARSHSSEGVISTAASLLLRMRFVAGLRALSVRSATGPVVQPEILADAHNLLRQYYTLQWFQRTIDEFAAEQPDLFVSVALQTFTAPTLISVNLLIGTQIAHFDIRQGVVTHQLPSLHSVRVNSKTALLEQLRCRANAERGC